MGEVNSKTDGNGGEGAIHNFTPEEYALYRQMYIKCCDKVTSKMKRNTFYEAVVGDLFPPPVAEFLFLAFSGAGQDGNGISFDNLMRGIGYFSGRVSSKANDDPNEWRRDRVKLMYQILSNTGSVNSMLNKTKTANLFRTVETPLKFEGVKEFLDRPNMIDAELFTKWALHNAEYFSFTQWLLSNEVVPGFQLSSRSITELFAVPTLYSTIAKITHLDEREISLLEKHFTTLCGSNKMSMDFTTFHSLVCPPIAEEITRGFFNAFDSNGDGTIDFNEYVCGLSACCRGPQLERRKFLFRMFDFDSDGMLSQAEIFNLVDISVRMQYQYSHFSANIAHQQYSTRIPSTSSSVRSPIPKDMMVGYSGSSPSFVDSPSVMEEIMNNYDPDKDSYIQPNDFLVWASSSCVLDVLCDLLEQICHVVFGLRPLGPEHEGSILKKFIKREKSLMSAGSKWYVIPQQWWLSWIEHTTCCDDDMLSLNNFTVGVNKTGVPVMKGYERNVKGSASVQNSPLAQRKKAKIGGTWRKKEYLYTVNPLPEDQKPLSAIDTSKLVSKDKLKAPQLTSEELLRSDIETKQECIPSAVWHSMVTWYGSNGPPIERTAIRDPYRQKGVKIELHPLVLNLYQHSQKSPSFHSVLSQQMSATFGAALNMTTPVLSSAATASVAGTHSHLPPLMPPASPIIGIQRSPNGNSNYNSGSSNYNNSSGQSSNLAPTSPTGSTVSTSSVTPSVVYKRTLTKTVVLSQDNTIADVRAMLMLKLCVRNEDMRLWHFKSEDCLILLNDDSTTLFEAGIVTGDNLLMEMRQVSGWPELVLQQQQISTVSSVVSENPDGTLSPKGSPIESRAGQAGLHNIGNTCFMNSALQCLSHTYALTSYFLKERHFYELNMSSRDGAQGQVALCYGHLIEQLWNEENHVTTAIRPAVIRECIIKHRSQFNNSNQHDAQEMLEAVLDLLHEDLNRVLDSKSYQALNEAEGRHDSDVAEEQWSAHIKNNNSVICDLFTGQMQSKITCCNCGRTTSKFDVFNVLSLSIPSDQLTIVYILLQKLDGTPPTRYALRVSKSSTYASLKSDFAPICNLSSAEILFFETNNRLLYLLSVPGNQIDDNLKIRSHAYVNSSLLAFQTIPSSFASEEEDEERCDQPLSQNGRETPDNTTPLLIETPSSVSNDSLVEMANGADGGEGGGNDQLNCVIEGKGASNDGANSDINGEMSSLSIGNGELNGRIETIITNGEYQPVSESKPANSNSSPAITSLYISEPDQNSTAAEHLNGSCSTITPNETLCNGEISSEESANYSRLKCPSNESQNNSLNQTCASKTDSLSPNPALSLTPSSSGYASDTWRQESLFLFGVHCKQTPNSTYFLWHNRTKSTLFGRPILIPLVIGWTNADIYAQVESQVARCVSSSSIDSRANHAKDCDEVLSRNGSYPFILRKVAIVPNTPNTTAGNGFQTFSNQSYPTQSYSLRCWNCPWFNVCRGCPLEVSDEIFEHPPNLQSSISTNHNSVQNSISNQTCSPVQNNINTSNGTYQAKVEWANHPQNTVFVIVIEWEPTIIHLRFNFAAENEIATHESVEKAEISQKQPLNLDDCLKLLTKDQIITDFSPCPKCQTTKIALSHHIWRSPAHLIVHLKRYEQPSGTGLNGRWIKSHKRVSFPIEDLNLLPFVSKGSHIMNKQLARVYSGVEPSEIGKFLASAEQEPELTSSECCSQETNFSSEVDDYFKYRLFSVSCHSGNLQNGHYVSVCRNPLTQKWYCFNDNSCKEIQVSSIPLDTTYLLFYELAKLDISHFMPSVEMKQPVVPPIEFKKSPSDFIKSFPSDGSGSNCSLM